MKVIQRRTENKYKTGKQKVNETKSWLFKKINKINKSLARMIGGNGVKIPIIKIWN